VGVVVRDHENGQVLVEKVDVGLDHAYEDGGYWLPCAESPGKQIGIQFSLLRSYDWP
jgi:hypothetical protein